MLHGLDLHVLPVFAEHADDAAVACRITEVVDPAFPHADGGEMRRLRRRGAPLTGAKIGNAIESDLARAPRLHRGPFDALMKVVVLAFVVVLQITGRAAGAARIDAHQRVAVGYPFLRIGDFPVLVFVGRAGNCIGVFLAHDFPGGFVTVLEGQPFAVGAVAHDRRILAIANRAEDVGAQYEAVVHCDRHIPVDLHAVANFAFVIAHLIILCHCYFWFFPYLAREARGVTRRVRTAHRLRSSRVRDAHPTLFDLRYWARTSFSSNQFHISATTSVR